MAHRSPIRPTAKTASIPEARLAAVAVQTPVCLQPYGGIALIKLAAMKWHGLPPEQRLKK